jgi:cytochrome c oxidase subunit III
MTPKLGTPPSAARTGVWVGMGAIAMTFAAYTSAMMVRREGATDWHHFQLPSILYVNTVILLASSVALEMGRRRVGDDYEVGRAARGYLSLALGLGVAFLIGQVLAWRDLAAQGLFLATNPSSAFFYVFTAAHGLHLIGGLAGLGYVLRRVRVAVGPGTYGALGAVALYWHFMDALWLYLLGVLALWL